MSTGMVIVVAVILLAALLIGGIPVPFAFAGVTIVLVLILGGGGWILVRQLQNQYRVVYQSYTASRGSISNSLSFSGTMQAISNVSFTSSSSTTVRSVYVKEGDQVQKGEKLPIDVKGQTIYYVGAAPAKPGYVIGPCGPTSSYRMDKYAPSLLDLGLKVMVGKGARGDEVISSIVKNNAVYLIAVGGAAALIAKCIKNVELICYEDLGTEAIYKYEVEDMPLIVAIDPKGNNIYVR